MSDKAKAAITAVLRRIAGDPRVAYYFDPITDCFDKLVVAHCELHGLEETKFRKEFTERLRFEAPERRGD